MWAQTHFILRIIQLRLVPMARRLEGKKVFVTAALRADVLADGGIAPDVRKLDVTAPGAIESMMESVGALDVLFNCAGYVHQGTILQASDDDWDISFAINVRSMVRTIRSALPAMIAHGGGSIINMASVCSSIKGLPNRAVYGTTKAAVLGLTKSIAADFVGQRVRCNAICPGTVETPSLRDRMAQLGDVDEARRMFTARQPMGRLANADEIVPIVVYLASDESSFATGQWFNIDGGITI